MDFFNKNDFMLVLQDCQTRTVEKFNAVSK